MERSWQGLAIASVLIPLNVIDYASSTAEAAQGTLVLPLPAKEADSQFRDALASSLTIHNGSAANEVHPPSLSESEANPTEFVVDLVVALRLGERYLGDLPIRITPDDVVSFPLADFVRLIAEVSDQTLVAVLEASADEQGRLNTQSATSSGLIVNYDAGLLEVQLEIPTDKRREQVISLRHQEEKTLEITDEASIAGFLTMRGASGYVSESADDEETGRSPVAINFDSGFRLFGETGFAILAEADYQEDSSQTWSRGDVRLIYDQPEDALRFSVGDLRFVTAGLQASQPILGAQIEQTYDLQPGRLTRPAGRRQFQLERPAIVEVIVNGRTVDRLSLEPGRFDIRDFPFVAGQNDVQLIVEDEVGRRQLLDFAFSLDNDLLDVGLSEFSYALGVASAVEDRSLVYYEGNPIFSFFHRVGVLDNLTLGANVQANEEQKLAGVESIVATPIGNFALDTAISSIDGVGTDVGLAIDYEFPFRGDVYQQRFSMRADYLGRRFGAIGNANPDNQSTFDLDIDYSRNLPADIRGTIGASFGFGRDGAGDARSLNLSLSRALTDRLVMGLSSQILDEEGQKPEVNALLTMSYRLGRQQRLRIQHSTDGDRSRFDYSKTGASSIGGMGAVVSIERQGKDEVGLFGSLDYTNSRFELDASHDVVTVGLDGDEREQATSLRLETSLAFAGRHLAWGRPIGREDSFAILHRHESLSDNVVLVNPSRDTAQAKADFLGAALIPLQPYTDERIEFDVDDLPVGYDIGAGRYHLRPSLSSGYALQVGSATSVTVLGTMLDAESNPIVLTGGEARSLTDSEMAPATVLTNSVGRFVVQSLKPGLYEINMFTKPPMVGQIEIGDDEIGLVDVGTISMAPN